MKRYSRNTAAAGLAGLMLLLTGAAGTSSEQNPQQPEEKVEYFAIWNDALHQDGFVVDSKGREHALDDFTESEKDNIYYYFRDETSAVNPYLTQEGYRADLLCEGDNLRKMVDKEGNLIGEGIFSQLWFSGDSWSGKGNMVYPVFRDAQTMLYGVRGERFEILLPAAFKSADAIYGPLFSCETPEGDCQVWNADTGKMLWQVPTRQEGGNPTVLFYNGEIAAVCSKDESCILWLEEDGSVKRRQRFLDIDAQSSRSFDDRYGAYEIAGLSCQDKDATRFLDTHGNELFSVPEKGLIRYVSDDCFLISCNDHSYLTDRKGKLLLDERNTYWYFYQSNHMLVAAYPQESIYSGVNDIFSSDGRMVIRGASAVYACGECCAYVTRGFSTGLMDYNGNWIWKRSVFQSLMD